MIHEIPLYDISFFVNSSDTTLFSSILYNTMFFFDIKILRSEPVEKYFDHIIGW